MSSASERLGAQARTVSKDIKEMGDIVRDAAQEKLGEVRENATEFYEQGRDKICGVGGMFTHFVREKPVKSLLIAVGIGFVLGRFSRNR
jgi:ElaB/YqjD/DUF883 family membrane-anchored ribosome-binding protein